MTDAAGNGRRATAQGDATRLRILDAALAEFAAHGLAGARVDRIARAAGANKNLIYVNFTNKETLFTRVLEHGLDDAFAALPAAAGDLPDFAERVFDFATANHDLYRLIEWAVLDDASRLPASRASFYAETIRSVRAAQDAGTITRAHSPEFLVTMVMAMATAWVPAFPFGRSTAGRVPDDARLQLRRAVKAMVGP
jgi:AcrR family transcriptional regulator